MQKVKKARLVLVLLLGAAFMARGQSRTGVINYYDGGYIEVKGLGIPSSDARSPQQQYTTAYRAAEVVARRAIAETIGTMRLTSDTIVSKNETLRDLITTQITQNLSLDRITIISETSMNDFIGPDPSKNGKVEITMRVPLTGPKGVYKEVMPMLVAEYEKRDKAAPVPVFTPPAPTPAPAPPQATPAPAPAADGLIVRVPRDFSPAPLPRILTDSGAVVYSPKDVRLEVLNTRGAAQYTNNEQKAKEVLEDMGATSILTVRGSTLTGVDAVLKNDDAQKVYEANKKNAFLNKARVVFLIGQ